jgi:hypothetical protein
MLIPCAGNPRRRHPGKEDFEAVFKLVGAVLVSIGVEDDS